MTTKKVKKADEEIQFTRPLTAKDKKHIAIYGRVLKYFRENGGRNSYAHLRWKQTLKNLGKPRCKV